MCFSQWVSLWRRILLHEICSLKRVCQLFLIPLIFPQSEGLKLLIGNSLFSLSLSLFKRQRGTETKCVSHVWLNHRHEKVFLICTCVKGMGSWPWLALTSPVSPVLVPPCHRISLSLALTFSPSDPHPHHPHPPPLPGASDPRGNKHNNQPDLSRHKAHSRTRALCLLWQESLFLSFLLFTSQSDVEKSVLTLKVGYRNITGIVLRAVRGKKQINTFHIPLRWSAIDHHLRIAAPLRNQHGVSLRNVLF